MARVRDIREDIHQPFYDSLVRGIGVSSINASSVLFGNAPSGDRAKTNMPTPGQIASDGVFLLKAVRGICNFQSLNDPDFNTVFGTQAAITGTLADGARAQDLYSLLAYGCNVTLTVGTKPMINAPFWYYPAGGGISGTSTENDRNTLTNGWASQQSILKLARDVPITVRQNFAAQCDFFPFLRIGTGLGAGGATIPADLDPLAELNSFDGLKIVSVMIDGVLTRDVQ